MPVNLIDKGSRTTLAFSVLALVGMMLFAVVAKLTFGQRGDAHLIDISGIARMHSQRIAYFTSRANASHPEADWRPQVEASIQAIRTGQIEAHGFPALDVVLGPAEQHALDANLDRYFRAARALEANPLDNAASEVIARLRPSVLGGLDDVVRLHTAKIAWQNSVLFCILIFGLVIGSITLVSAYGLLALAERRLRRLLDSVTAEREEIQSLFDENPDAIAVYDDSGTLVRTNRARCELIGLSSSQMLGKHLSSFVDSAGLMLALDLFERAKNGERYVGEMQLRSAAGNPIDVHLNLFPNVINGRHAGVMVVSRDIRELKAAQNEAEGLARRLSALCGIASVGSGGWRDQVQEALALAVSGLGCDWGAVAQIDGDFVNVLSVAGAFPGMGAGMRVPLGMTMTQTIIASDEVFEHADLLDSPWHDYNTVHQTAWRNITAMRLVIDGSIFGTVAVGGSSPRLRPLSPADHDFVRTVAALIASLIEREREHARLDSMAFVDSLTGLPNRAFAINKLDEIIARARRDDTPFALYFIDLNKFKQINDDFGHGAGDAVLREVAKRFMACTRGTDTVARLGGDEFLVLQPMVGTRVLAAELARRIASAIIKPISFEGVTHILGCSIGISLYPGDGEDSERLLERADEAMYRAKLAGNDTTAEFAAPYR